MSTFRLIEADCIEAMSSMDEASIDAIVTDPPYLIGFMGKRWDQGGAFVERKSNRRAGSFESEHGNHNPTDAVDAARTRRAENSRAQTFHEAWATQALRVLKPGGHLLAFGGTRTYHRLTCALEDAGFEIRDCLAWLYGSGFPKSLDVSKAIDKAAGAEREVIGPGINAAAKARHAATHDPNGGPTYLSAPNGPMLTAPATPEAQRWQGFGTSLKPAFEPIVLARKPLIGSVAKNVTQFGTGALNIDGTRIATEDEVSNHGRAATVNGWDPRMSGEQQQGQTPGQVLGRWPANVILDEEAAAILDEQSGERPTGDLRPYVQRGQGTVDYAIVGAVRDVDRKGDSGGASRFFKVVKDDETQTVADGGARPAAARRSDHPTGAILLPPPVLLVDDVEGLQGRDVTRFRYSPKADREERNRGLHDAFDEKPLNWSSGEQSPGTFQAEGTKRSARNAHPTVKPVELMQWLVRLVCPPGGVVLDPFTGSGSTGMAALREGFDFIGIEREGDYCEIARARIIGDGPLLNVETE